MGEDLRNDNQMETAAVGLLEPDRRSKQNGDWTLPASSLQLIERKLPLIETDRRLLPPQPDMREVGFSPLLVHKNEGKRVSTLTSSFIAHGLALVTLVLLPIMFTEAIDVRSFQATWLVAPPPPPPPPPPAAAQPVARTRRTSQLNAEGRLKAPTAVPKEIAQLNEPEMPPDMGVMDGMGIPGAVPGGSIGGVLGGVIGGIPTLAPPAAPAPSGPVRAGSEVRPPRLLLRVPPVYPTPARSARIEGSVRLEAIIGADGQVHEVRVLDGNQLLAQAAVEAVRQWRYEPTRLNGRPVDVLLEVTVLFQLNR
jgi:protein TonB